MCPPVEWYSLIIKREPQYGGDKGHFQKNRSCNRQLNVILSSDFLDISMEVDDLNLDVLKNIHEKIKLVLFIRFLHNHNKNRS